MEFQLLYGLIVFFLFLLSYVNSNETHYDEYHYLPGYGTRWMFFPDGDDVPRLISLEPIPEDMLRRSLWDGFDGIEFRLYTRYNKKNYVLLDERANLVNKSEYKFVENLNKIPLKLITHGWESTADKNAVINIKDAYLESLDVNVIAVDWSSVAVSVLYPIVASQTSKVGKIVAEFLDDLNKLYNVSGSQMHLIGHSLGAHVMGNAGYWTKLKIDRITGLDPARPLFEVPAVASNFKLDLTDAEFVDVIHTCSGILGIQDSIGDADFYPNDGSAPQPGCDQVTTVIEACSHSRSHFFYAESIRNPYSFPAYSCNSWWAYKKGRCNDHITYMGENVNRSATGTFYLITNNGSPYGRGLQ